MHFARIMSTADIELLADPFDTWEEIPAELSHNERMVQKYGSIEDAEWQARRDEAYDDNDEAF